MCADVSIHDTDGHNPHAHILLTVRPLDQDGTWQYKTQKEYLCVRNGEEQLVAWRVSWADVTNQYLELAHVPERIDHRSHADRGVDEKPTIHEGVFARRMEKKERCQSVAKSIGRYVRIIKLSGK